MKFLTVDPSLRNTAFVWGELNEDNTITPVNFKIVQTEKSKEKQVKASSDLISRCREILKEIQEVLEAIKPDVCFIETPSGSQNYSGALSYAVSCCIIATISPPPIEVTPVEVKKLTVGSKTATKKEVMEYCTTNYKDFPYERKKDGSLLEGKMEHICDAIIIAEAGTKTREFKMIKDLIK